MMKMIKRRRTRRTALLTALVTLVVVSAAVAVGSFVSQVAKIDYVTDDKIVSVYLVCLVALWQLVSWTTPKRR